LSAEKIFQRESSAFLFVFWALFGFLDGVSWSVFAVLACACMLFSVKFHVVKREVRVCCTALREREFQEKKELIA
jgi:hypothetical protein